MSERLLVSRNKREGFFAGWSGRFRLDGIPMWQITGGFGGSFVRVRRADQRLPLASKHFKKLEV